MSKFLTKMMLSFHSTGDLFSCWSQCPSATGSFHTDLSPMRKSVISQFDHLEIRKELENGWPITQNSSNSVFCGHFIHCECSFSRGQANNFVVWPGRHWMMTCLHVSSMLRFLLLLMPGLCLRWPHLCVHGMIAKNIESVLCPMNSGCRICVTAKDTQQFSLCHCAVAETDHCIVM